MSGPDRTVTAGQVWRHYKGTPYFVVAVGRHSETQEELVIYRRTDTKEVWVRPLEMFLNETEPGVKRFLRVR